MSRRWTAALALGYILMFYSEFLFSTFNGNEVDLPGVVPMWLVYSLEAYVFLAVLTIFRVRSPAALLLAGAVYGWLLEGVVVQTMYLAFPFQVAWTGLAWHALIDVMVGWYLVRRTLFKGSLAHTAGLAILIGLFWGFWSIWAWQEVDMMSPGRFAQAALLTFLPLLPAYAALNRLEPFRFEPNRTELRLLIGLHGLVFVLVVTFIPYAALILPPLLWLIYRALRRHQQSAAPATIHTTFVGRVSSMQYAVLLLIPAVAAAWYAISVWLEARLETNYVVAGVTIPISVGWFMRALIRLNRETPAVL